MSPFLRAASASTALVSVVEQHAGARRHRWLTLVALLAWLGSGCTSFKTNPLAPQEAVEGQQWVRLTVVEPPTAVNSGPPETVVLKNPWASDEAIGGEVCTKNCASFFGELVFDWFWTAEYSCHGNRTVGFGAIRELETRRFDALKTTLLLGAIAGTFGLLILIYAAGSS